MKIYFFGWPSEVGGAGTKLAHLLRLLRREFELTAIPFAKEELSDVRGQEQLRELGVQWMPFADLPERLNGWGVILCNQPFVASPMLAEVRRRGLRIAWSSEMMWTTRAELGAVAFGQFDAVLYVSVAQRLVLEPEYLLMLSEASAGTQITSSTEVEGWLGNRQLRWVMTGNYIDPAEYPFVIREPRIRYSRPLVIGRLSRPDPTKYPDDFPQHYEGLGLQNARFRVMAWSEELASRWPAHHFGSRWDLLRTMAEPPVKFLQSLDLFVYQLGPKFRESWGRAVVEAMLTGAVPLVPAGMEHHLHNLVPHGEGGFHCASAADYGRYARLLEEDDALRDRLAHQARAFAERSLCNEAEHLEQWRRLFHGRGPA